MNEITPRQTALAAALEGVSLSSVIQEAPDGYYLLDLLVTNAIIEPHALLARELDLLHVIRDWPELSAFMAIDVPEGTDQLSNEEQQAALDAALRATGWQVLEAVVGGRELALRLMAALSVLSRGKIYSARDFGLPYDVAVNAAKRGYLSLMSVNVAWEAPREVVNVED